MRVEFKIVIASSQNIDTRTYALWDVHTPDDGRWEGPNHVATLNMIKVLC